MRPGREIDTRIAQEVMGHHVWVRQKVLYENHSTGERPLRKYSAEMEWAWEVVLKMKMTLIPIVGGQWFAFVGGTANEGWESPQELLKVLESGNFSECGAAVGDNPALVICQAALKAVEKRGHQEAVAEMPPRQEGDLEPAEDLGLNPDEIIIEIPLTEEIKNIH